MDLRVCSACQRAFCFTCYCLDTVFPIGNSVRGISGKSDEVRFVFLGSVFAVVVVVVVVA